jgi:hypothetical protein
MHNVNEGSLVQSVLTGAAREHKLTKVEDTLNENDRGFAVEDTIVATATLVPYRPVWLGARAKSIIQVKSNQPNLYLQRCPFAVVLQGKLLPACAGIH